MLSIPLLYAADDDGVEDYAEWAIEDLLQVKIVTSVGKKEQSLADAAAAVYVVTSKEIRRSGVTTIPDALRMVPGLQVSKVNSHAWAISSRGFNSFFSNKLLVLVDGRSVYAAEFSGVWWDTVDMLIDDIERIEVIRGSGSTLWGANAVNGVINIITKDSKDTQGGLVSVAVGTEDKNVTSLRYGGMLDEATETSFRVYTKILKRDSYANVPTSDKWHSTQAGFRIDGHPFSKDNKWMLQTNAYRTKEDDMHWFTRQSGESNVKGFNMLSSLEHKFSEESILTTQLYYDEYQRKMPTLSLFNKVLDLDIQHRYTFSESNEFIWGIGYRWLSNKVLDTPFFAFVPQKRIDNLFSAFIQDELKLAEKHTLTLGTKLEHNDYTGWEIQPNIRYLWKPSDKLSLWSAVSRAVRTPSRREQDSLFTFPFPPSQNPFAPASFIYQAVNNPDFQSEIVTAYELGIRQQISDRFSWDLALFYNDYDKLLAGRRTITPDLANGRVLLVEKVENSMIGKTAGLELIVDYKQSKDLEFSLAYSFITMDFDAIEGIEKIYENSKSTPHHQVSVRMTKQLIDNLSLTTWLRYVDGIESSTLKVDAYTTFDMSLAWQVTDDLELSLVGQNLFDKQHVEFLNTSINPLVGEVERSVYGQIRWEF